MKKINFLATDGVELQGLLYNCESKTEKIILSVHGMSSNCFKKREDIIAKTANENGIDYFCFNNRGSELVRYITKTRNEKREKSLAGTTYEDVLEGYEDITGAIIKIKELGYKEIYLQGHSLGCTKIVYTYHELKGEEETDLLNSIKGIILLSLVDIPGALRVYLGENFESYLKLAEEKEQEGKQFEVMPKEAFIHPVCVKTFLRYARDNKEIDFAKYGEDKEMATLNQIETPLFMRWGNDNEMIAQKAEELVTNMSNLISNPQKDIDFIDGANHSYTEKEEIIANQIIEFIKRYEK